MQKGTPFQLDAVSVRLVKDAPLFSNKRIKSPEDAISVVGEFLCDMDREVICMINLKTDGTPVNCNFASMGAVNQAVAEPRELLKSAILSNAASMIMVHNHVSGFLEPSKEDTVLTDRLLKISSLVGIPLWDHVIVGGDNSRYFSFHEKGLIKIPRIAYAEDYAQLDFPAHAMVAEKGRSR